MTRAASAGADDRRVAVTGGTGFIGAHVGRRLAALGYSVLALSNEEPCAVEYAIWGEFRDRIEHRLLDITRLDECIDCLGASGVNAIVHAAGRVGLEGSLRDPVGFYQANVLGTVNVCEAAHRARVRRVVAMSSNAVYYADASGRRDEQRCTSSLALGNPAAHYGSTKRAAEAVLLDYAAYGDVDAIALRISSVYGFGMRSAIYVKPMVEDAVAGRPSHFASGGAMARDYTAVSDVADVVAAALAANVSALSQRVFNVASGVLTPARDVAGLVHAIVPGAVIEIADVLSATDALNLPMRAALDCSAAASAFGFVPTTLRSGLESFVHDYRAFLARS